MRGNSREAGRWDDAARPTRTAFRSEWSGLSFVKARSGSRPEVLQDSRAGVRHGRPSDGCGCQSSRANARWSLVVSVKEHIAHVTHVMPVLVPRRLSSRACLLASRATPEPSTAASTRPADGTRPPRGTHVSAGRRPSRVPTSTQGSVRAADGLSEGADGTRAGVAFVLHSDCFAVVFAPQGIDESAQEESRSAR